jgi:hypothetical protein
MEGVVTFRVGQKVVCVDDRSSYCNASRSCPLKKMTVYEIVDICKTPDGASHLKVPGLEPYFSSRRFRPLVERKTDISIFTAMLNPSKQEIEA